MIISALLTLAMFGGPSAFAAAFEPKTMRDPLPARELDRALVLGKGWLEFGLGVDYKVANGYWDADGKAQTFDSAQWTYTTERLGIRYGVTRRGELNWTFKTHAVRLTNEVLGTDSGAFGIGDPTFGYTFHAYQSTAPLTSVVAYGLYKAPAANESPGNYVGGANVFSNFVMTTGTPDLTLGARAKGVMGPAALTVDLGYMRRISNVVQYAIETENSQFSGRVKPGDEVHADLEALGQAGPVSIIAGGTVTKRAKTKIGTSSEGFWGDRRLVAVADSDGWALDARAGAIWSVTQVLDVDLRATIPLRGEDLMFFPIEDLHPTRGATFSGTVEFRY